MSSPSSSSSTSQVSQSSSLNINALISGDKWGGIAGSGANLSYSFPWASGTATFSGPNGGNYSSLNEPNASSHYGLNTTQQSAARSALQLWADVANIVFSEVTETSSNVGDIRFAWTSASYPMSSGAEPWGWAGYPNSYWSSGGDVWISALNSSTATNSWASGSYNFEALLHELGHALGLKHPFDDTPVLPSSLDNRLYSIMSYTNPAHDIYPSAGYVNGKYDWISYSVIPDSPMVLDIAAIQYLYGANNNYHTSNDIYTFDTAKPFFKTLWDAGGIDTISAGNFILPCVIDLTQGNYSSLGFPPPSNTGGATTTYDGTNNVGIAYGCIIENAIGGSGNDTLTGNGSNNSLEGGAGNDTISGGGGDSDICIFSEIFADYTYSYSVGNNTFTLSCTTTGTDWVSGVEFFQFKDMTKSASQLQGLDTVPPILNNLSPADNATEVIASANLVLTFNEAVKAGIGNIIIFNNNGTVAKTIAVTDTSQVSISGSSITINPGTDLATGSSYFVNMAAGVLLDLAENSFAGITDTTTYNFKTIAENITPITSTVTKAKVFLNTDDSFTVSSSGTTLYGGTGNDAVSIASGVTGVILSQTVERINFSGTSDSYAFKQTGNIINVYDTAGSTLLAKAPIQDDNDGTVFSFSNGTASALMAAGGIMSLGGATVSASTASVLTPTITTSTTSTSNITKAKVFLGTDDSFTVSSSGTTLYGGTGNDAVSIASGVTGVILSQTVERINFSGPSDSYAFKQTGNIINVYDTAGSTLLAKAPIQDDNDGTVFSFSNGTASALMAAGGIMSLGGVTVSASTATVLTLIGVVAADVSLG